MSDDSDDDDQSPQAKAATTTRAARRRCAQKAWLEVLAFAAIYLIWGSTYMAIRSASGRCRRF